MVNPNIYNTTGQRARISGGGNKTAWGLEEAPHLAEAIEEHVEVREDGASGHLHDVVEGLTGVVPQPTVGVVEARQHRLDQLLQVEPGVLRAGGCCSLRSTPQGQGRAGTATGPRNQQIWGVWLPTDSSWSWLLPEAALGLSFQGEIGAALLSQFVKTNPRGGTRLVFLEHPAQETVKKSPGCRPADSGTYQHPSRPPSPTPPWLPR